MTQSSQRWCHVVNKPPSHFWWLAQPTSRQWWPIPWSTWPTWLMTSCRPLMHSTLLLILMLSAMRWGSLIYLFFQYGWLHKVTISPDRKAMNLSLLKEAHDHGTLEPQYIRFSHWYSGNPEAHFFFCMDFSVYIQMDLKDDISLLQFYLCEHACQSVT